MPAIQYSCNFLKFYGTSCFTSTYSIIRFFNSCLFFRGSGLKTGDNSSVASLNTRSLEKENNICAERGRNDGSKQIDYPSAILKFDVEATYK